MRTITMAAAVVLAAAAVTGCGNGLEPRKSAKPETTVTPASEPPDTPEAEPTGDESLTLTDTATYENNVEVSLSGFTRAVSSEYASPQNTPYLRFKARVENGSGQTLDLNGMYVQCMYGDEGQASEEIFDTDKGLDGTPGTHLRPGRSVTVTLGCELPKDETYMQIEVTPDMESETAIFAGDVK